MKARDLRERTVEDLRELEKSLAKDVFANRFKNFTNRLDDTSSINKARRDLARVKTLLREHALTGAIKAPSTSTSTSASTEEKPKPKKAAPAKKAAAPGGPKKEAAAKKPAAKKAKKSEEAK
jgi:large subunit ribosomal protein L29